MIAHQLLLASLLSLVQAQETILGAFVLHRHGDRTTKAWPPAKLTDLGYSEVFEAGTYYRNRYITATPNMGLDQDIVKLSQLSVEAPVDIVLQPSAIGWLQGLYPPVGPQVGSQTIANGSTIEAPLNGYQLIPVNLVSAVVSTANSESTTWLQGSSGCGNAVISSNNYFISDEYVTTLNSTQGYYQSLAPVVNGTFALSSLTYKNAYAIFDLINVATINNKTINSASLLTSDTIVQLQSLANQHEFGLAYNSSDSIRAIAGSTLAAQILQALNQTVISKSATKLNVQFSAYAAFLSFFGLAKLPSVSANFTGIVGYASSMAFELVTNSTVNETSYPTADEISVRFMFTNGTAAGSSGLTAYPLFGQSEVTLPWSNFSFEMAKIAIGDQASWCKACGNTTGVCASSASSASSSSTPTPSASTASTSDTSSGSGISTAVGGVIGAMVTLAVILGIEALILLVGGLRVVRKRSVAASPTGSETGAVAKS